MKSKKVEVITLPVGQMKSNCYLIIENIGKKCLIVDAGDDADFLETVIREKKLLPQAILTTHGHFDHIMAVRELQLNFKIPFFIHKKDEFLAKNMIGSAKHFLGFDPGPPPVIDGYLDKVKGINLGGVKLKIIETPGHTPGSVCFYQNEEGFVICGDLMFAEGAVGRTDFSYSNKDLLEKSIRKIYQLSPGTVLYPGHGPSFVYNL